jgi:hypothetical protein
VRGGGPADGEGVLEGAHRRANGEAASGVVSVCWRRRVWSGLGSGPRHARWLSAPACPPELRTSSIAAGLVGERGRSRRVGNPELYAMCLEVLGRASIPYTDSVALAKHVN